MKKKNLLNPKLSLNKKTVSVLLQEPGIAMAGKQLAALKGGRLTTIGKTCIPWTFGEACEVN
ncbi:class I lanthipeptide [Chitinophaga sp. 22536]|uniref:class I lanthipeptide n=1 Tax=unclassified Chitinophaga TaxID=2619133 RepID=UPI003F869B6D